jgi:CheY-like chemotaxis protein
MTARAPAPGRDVLVVEDNLPSQLVMREMLKSRGLPVRIVGNGREALDSIAAQRPALVLMDCQMPVMDGYEAMQRIRALEALQPEGPRLPIVAITANAFRRDLDRCIECGADAVLTKPVMLAGLDRILADWLDLALPAADPPPPAAAPSAVLNPVNLASLRANVAAADFMAFVAKFATSQAQLLAEIRQALTARDAAALGAALHGFKGGAAFVGAVEVPALCQAFEQLVSAGKLDAVAARLEKLAAAHDQLRQAVEDFAVTRPGPTD